MPTTGFTTNGTFNAPVTGNVTVECWGGGGAGGGGGTANKSGGGGGGGGQYARKVVAVTLDTPYSVIIGLGGTTVNAQADNIGGGDTTFDTNVVIAKGGGGGRDFDIGGLGGSGSIAGSVGDLIYYGGNGADGVVGHGGGGGSGAGSTGIGNNGTADIGGAAKADNGGTGGNGSVANSGNGLPASLYGGGGGGATKNGVSGNGADGYVLITWVDVTPTPTSSPEAVTPTPTQTPTITPTESPIPASPTPTQTPSITPSITITQTPTNTPTNTVTPSITPTRTPTPTVTPSITPSPILYETNRPFAVYKGVVPPGTHKVFNLLIGDTVQDYSTGIGGTIWFGGPGEDFGYIIAKPSPVNPDHPTFWRTVGETEAAFIYLVNRIRKIVPFYTTAAECIAWLNANEYYTDYS